MHIPASIILVIAISSVKTESDVDLKDKVAVVTGAARGIGRAIADHLLKEEVRVVIIVDKNLTQGLVTETEFKSKYGEEKVWFIHGDITIDLDWVFDEIFERYGYVNFLVNNAGIINEYDPVLTIYTNAVGTTLWSQKFYNAMRVDHGGKGGTIMNIASIDAYSIDPFLWFYKTTKYAIYGLSVGLGHEWNYMSTNVRVYALCPGFTYTQMTDQQMVVDEQVDIFTKFRKVIIWQTADQVGQAVAKLYKFAKTGTAYTVEGGELSLSPLVYNVSGEFLLSLE
ncbi:15-hydroxyprostaglandin dehydrogenase [NAD(+)] [Manduca sexta]|uniref:15-hydroxyprostaglandin dehydrogenase [NAD(+)] n=1 Tax=Manduca sexta TaxID=7130 RepID=UPI001183AC4D|nr:15-hydroxyprostaglandin dehydrogenase [NAD(+)] [Manduca sexta]